MTTTNNTLAPCPFCSAGTTSIRENGRIWQGMKYGEPSSVSVLHHCDGPIGQPHRAIERVGKDMEGAIEAWNRRAPAPASQPVAAPAGTVEHDSTPLPTGMEPFAWADDGSTLSGLMSSAYRVVTNETKQAMPNTAAAAYTESLYTAAQVQAMLAAEHSARKTAQQQLEECKTELAKLEKYRFMLARGAAPDLGRVLSIADEHALESNEDGSRLLDRGGLLQFAKDIIAAPSVPVREPLTEEQIYAALGTDFDAIDSVEQDPESWSVIVQMIRVIESAHGITAAEKGGQHAD